jgi:nicotinamide mononucleotide adenylyltransferase
MFVGRWQPWHEGHRWLIDQRLKAEKKVLICIRDIPPDEANPFTSEEVYNNITAQLQFYIKHSRVKLIVIPDIESINYGRGVGYDIIEHSPPEEIAEISATRIRQDAKK